jgi:hypothetical protein
MQKEFLSQLHLSYYKVVLSQQEFAMKQNDLKLWLERLEIFTWNGLWWRPCRDWAGVESPISCHRMLVMWFCNTSGQHSNGIHIVSPSNPSDMTHWTRLSVVLGDMWLVLAVIWPPHTNELLKNNRCLGIIWNENTKIALSSFVILISLALVSAHTCTL